MKQLLLLFILNFNFNLFAQTKDFTGTYVFYSKSIKGEIVDYKIQLNENQTFIFTSYVYNGNVIRGNTWLQELL